MLRSNRIPIACFSAIVSIGACSEAVAPDDVIVPPVAPQKPSAACETFSDASAKPPTLRTVTPQSTDAAINTALDDHLVWLPATTHLNKLVVFLASSRAAPSTAKIFQEEAARLGYHVIGLAYPNNPGLASFCPQSADPEACYDNVRRQIITGSPQTSFVQVNKANSINNRLAKLLVYLDEKFPGEGWGQYAIPPSEANAEWTMAWDKIVVSGHSQGAGHSAMIAQLEGVNRVVLLSGVTDGINNQATAWLRVTKTPTDRYYVLTHKRDLFYPTIVSNWQALGMTLTVGPASVDSAAPPYGRSHALFTDVIPKTGTYDAPAPHATTGVDFATPVAGDGTPLFRNVWRYMLGYCTA